MRDRSLILSGTHPQISLLIRLADQSVRDGTANHKRNAEDALLDARGAFDAHLRSLATPETIRLAQAVLDAALAVGAAHGLPGAIELSDSSVSAVLLAPDSKKAAA